MHANWPSALMLLPNVHIYFSSTERTKFCSFSFYRLGNGTYSTPRDVIFRFSIFSGRVHVCVCECVSGFIHLLMCTHVHKNNVEWQRNVQALRPLIQSNGCSSRFVHFDFVACSHGHSLVHFRSITNTFQSFAIGKCN